jgi:iron complex transport system substrate-binding protein
MRTSLRRTALAAAALPLAVLLSACGSSAVEQPDASQAAASGSFPVTIEHKYGSTTVESEPTRIVSVGFSDQDTILAFGVAPVGVREWYGEQPYATWPWAQDALGDAQPTVLGNAEIEFEKVAALKPDLIVGLYSGMTEADYATLSKIAPTLAQSDEFADYGQPWQETTRTVGSALGQPERAGELVDEVEQRFAKAREDHPELAGKTAVVAASFEAGNVNAYGPQDVRGRLLADLGLQLPKPVVDGAKDSFFTSFSNEQLAQLDGDAIVWNSYDDAAVQRIQALPLRDQLTAVRTGGEVFLDEIESGAGSFSSVLSLPALLDSFVPRLAAAVDGDATTKG